MVNFFFFFRSLSFCLYFFSVHLFNILQLLKVMNSSTYASIIKFVLDKSASKTRTRTRTHNERVNEMERVCMCVKEAVTNHLKSWHTNFNSVRIVFIDRYFFGVSRNFYATHLSHSSTAQAVARVWIKRPILCFFSQPCDWRVHVVQNVSMLKNVDWKILHRGPFLFCAAKNSKTERERKRKKRL